MAKIATLKDKNGENIYPSTFSTFIYDNNGKSVDSALNGLRGNISSNTSDEGKSIAINDGCNHGNLSISVKGNSSQNGTPTPETPVDIISCDNPTLYVNGKNLWDSTSQLIAGNVNMENGAYIATDVSNMRIDVAHDSKALRSIYIKKGTTISFSFKTNISTDKERYLCMKLSDESYKNILIKNANSVTYTATEDIVNINKPITVDDNMSKYPFTLMISISKGATIDMEWKPQLLRNDTLLPYEPYKEIQSVQLTCELNGISDVRDELVVRADGTGQLIQRIQLYDCSQMPNNKSIVTNPDNTYYVFSVDKYNTNATRVISTHFTSKSFDKTWGNAFKVNGNIYFGRKGIPESITDADAMKQWLIENKVKILFQLIEPIIIDLSAEEVKKILALHTNKPNTTIWNDQNADMQITYVAAAKNYIDNKLTELENSISSTASITALEDCETE